MGHARFGWRLVAALAPTLDDGARALFYDTVEQVIVPGLEQHGLPAHDAWNERHARAA